MEVAEINDRFSADEALSRVREDPREGSLESELDRLAALPAYRLDLAADAPLPTAIRALADAAGMQYFNIPDAQARNIVVNLTIEDNPFRILRQMANLYGFEMRYEQGIWRFGFVDTSIQIAKAYPLTHYTFDRVMGAYGPRIVDVSDISKAGNLQYQASNTLVETIKGLLSGDTNVFVTDEMGRDPLFRQRPFYTQRPKMEHANVPAKVTFDEDSRQLFVKATYDEQMIVREFLTAVDNPADLIEVEVKFLETELDPESSFGMDWSGVLEDGYGVGVRNLQSMPGEWSFPNTILSAQDTMVRLKAFSEDKDSRMVQYPRTVTLSNREVVFDAVQRIPYIADQVVRADETISETIRKKFMEIGTRIRVRPVVQNDDSIYLDLQIEVSDLVGMVELGGSPVPQTSTRRFSQSVILEDNYTLATGGLERSFTETVDKRIPLLGDIPFFGFAFKNKSNRELRTNLIMLVTVRRVDKRGGGIAEKPRFITPAQGESDPRRVFEGTPHETFDDIVASFGSFSADVDELAQSYAEGRYREADERHLELLKNEAELMLVRIEELKLLEAVDIDDATALAFRISREHNRLERIRP